MILDPILLVLIGFIILCVAIIVYLDPLEKYDKSLDDPDHKKTDLGVTGGIGGNWH